MASSGLEDRLPEGGDGGFAATIIVRQVLVSAADLADQRNGHDVDGGLGQAGASGVDLALLRRSTGVVRGADRGAGVDVPEIGSRGHGRTCDAQAFRLEQHRASAQRNLVNAGAADVELHALVHFLADGLDGDVFLARPAVIDCICATDGRKGDGLERRLVDEGRRDGHLRIRRGFQLGKRRCTRGGVQGTVDRGGLGSGCTCKHCAAEQYRVAVGFLHSKISNQKKLSEGIQTPTRMQTAHV